MVPKDRSLGQNMKRPKSARIHVFKSYISRLSWPYVLVILPLCLPPSRLFPLRARQKLLPHTYSRVTRNRNLSRDVGKHNKTHPHLPFHSLHSVTWALDKYVVIFKVSRLDMYPS